MVVRRMSAREARANFGDLLGSVYYTKQAVVIERKGRPFAVVISPEEYEKLVGKERAWTTVDRVRERNAGRDPDEILQDMAAELEAVRQEMYEEERKAGR